MPASASPAGDIAPPTSVPPFVDNVPGSSLHTPISETSILPNLLVVMEGLERLEGCLGHIEHAFTERLSRMEELLNTLKRAQDFAAIFQVQPPAPHPSPAPQQQPEPPQGYSFPPGGHSHPSFGLPVDITMSNAQPLGHDLPWGFSDHSPSNQFPGKYSFFLFSYAPPELIRITGDSDVTGVMDEIVTGVAGDLSLEEVQL